MLPVRIHHVCLSVVDMVRSAPFYEALFQLPLEVSFDDPPLKLYRTPEGQAIDLRQDPDVASDRFTQTCAGLDHLAFVCADRGELEAWQARADELGAEHSGIQQTQFGLHLNVRDPDGIPLEFYVPAG